MSGRRALATGLLTCALTLAACGTEPPAAAPPSGSAPAVSTVAATTPLPTSTPTTAPSSAPESATGKVVVLDPGHNGGNAANPQVINREVPAGRGRTKSCNTTGTATDDGHPEHEFTWDLAQRVSAALTAEGVEVVLTRPDNTGVGPCVDRRAAIGNEAAADAVVSLHADGSTAPGARGFHVAYSAPPLNAAQGEPALRLARTVRDSLTGAGFTTATYTGSAGLSPRDDLGGLNLATRPSVLVECGNMRDAAEAAVLTSPAGRQRYAEGIADGILGFLG
ncbi:N-acetylmuramoyl-L-alanine amidase [Actinokineospora pegani]|uniref:N-acetylmuramoyl-L-alanine amidase n=1 Tax=Actinokineospora pegani TaxID=2654637 RepID=UPI0012EA6DF8|nr:N-acetylmuramoyl-L-alanine amidase [Actinokineospora pegani]